MSFREFEDEPYLHHKGVGEYKREMPDLTDEFRVSNEDEILEAFFAKSAEQNVRVTALAAILPLIDSGIDVTAVEGAIKDPQLCTLEVQNEIREQMVEGTLSALRVFGASNEEINAALKMVAEEGIATRQVSEQIAERIPVWDKLTFLNMFYGPDRAGRMLTRDVDQA